MLRCVLLSVLFLSFTLSAAQAQQVRVIQSTKHAPSALPVRDLDQIESNYRNTDGPHPVRLFPLPPQKPGKDPVRQGKMGTVQPTVGEDTQLSSVQQSINFDGLDSQENAIHLGLPIAPPDPNIAVGPNHIVEMVNSLFVVYNKVGGLEGGPEPINSLWWNFGGPCETKNDGDPIALYDEYADRWLLSQFALFDTDGDKTPDEFYECIAVSQTSDPTGLYWLYAFEMPGFNDYPKLAVGPDSYLYTHNQYGSAGFVGATAGAFERDAMLNGQQADMVLFGPDPNRSSLLPADFSGPLPPGPTPGFFAELKTTTSQIAIYELDVDWSSPSYATFSQEALLSSFYFDPVVCDDPDFVCIPQPNGVKLDALSDRLMFPLSIRDMGTHLAMVATHTVDANVETGGVRWYEFRHDGFSWSIYQEGTYAPFGSENRWMGSISMNSEGKIGLVYSVSGTSTHPSIRYTGRRPSDPLGVMTLVETSIIEGSASQNYPDERRHRWGDYAALVVDPTDDKTFWAVHAYGSNDDPQPNWATRIASFQIPNAPAEPLEISISGPTALGIGEDGTWHAIVSGGRSPFSYQWDYMLLCIGAFGAQGLGDIGTMDVNCDQWYSGGTGSSFSRSTSGEWTMRIRLTVMDADNVVKTAYKTVVIGGGSAAAPAMAKAGITNLPERYALHTVVPNPIGGVGTIRYDLPEASEVELVVYDLLGREAARLAGGFREAGVHHATFDAADLISGVYLVRLRAGSFVATKRITVVK